LKIKPQALKIKPLTGVLRNAAIGFHGKIPARGDFVHAGLPRDFIEPWDGWMQRMVAASRSALGEAWLPAWLEAAVWHFALTPGICGRGAVIGLWLPSVDAVGRYFPLTLAAVADHAETRELIRESGGFLTAVESAGRDVLENDLPPKELAARLAAAAEAAGEPAANPSLCPPKGGMWWTAGAPKVSAGLLLTTGLPDQDTFLSMLVGGLPMLIGGSATPPTCAPEQP
jgi:type VI secretion system protein ImpM